VANERQARGQSQPKPAGSAQNLSSDAPRSEPNDERPRDRFSELTSQDAFTPKLPEVTLPKSGGAIRGLGEKFSVGAATGTANLAVPLPLGAARMTPQLRLTYDSGGGNGIFGFGWSLDTPTIRRKTDKGIPQYDDVGASDVYIISGAEDLVPILDATGARMVVPRQVFGVDYTVAYYRPRIEGLFARIERWRATTTGIAHWRTISRDNVITFYGDGPDSRVADPADASRIFEWRISRVFDDKGNATFYVYDHENGAGLDLASAHEANRTPAVRNTQTYLRKVFYGNRTPYFVDFTAAAEPAAPAAADWMFAVSLDYGDHGAGGVDPDGVWTVRPDPFSVYRSGFEVRTYRRAQRLLLFNNFPADSIGAYGLARSLDLTYSDQLNPPEPQAPIYTFIASLTQTGYRTDAQGRHAKSLPPLEFDYTQPTFDPTIHAVDRDSLSDLPEGVDGSRFRWLDLDGEGLSGIICSTPEAWYYKRNLSAANVTERSDKTQLVSAKFGPLGEIARAPGHGDATRSQFLTLDGDGMVDVVALSGTETGYYARTSDRDFAPFKRFDALPQIDWSDPNLKFIDVTGDGLADVLVTEDSIFTFYASLGSSGFDIGQFVRTPWDEEKGPKVVFADGTDTIFIADMSGDGLNDIVRVRNGETAYWPNLGYGRFGDGPWAAVRFRGCVRCQTHSSRRRRRIGIGRRALCRAGRRARVVQPVGQCVRRAGAARGVSRRRCPAQRADRRSARLRNGVSGLVFAVAAARRGAVAVRRPDGRREAASADRRAQQFRRRDACDLRAVDPLLSGRRKCRAAVGDALAVPGLDRRARRDDRLDRAQSFRQPLRLPSWFFRRPGT
jgi:hypothetical protein